MLASASSHSRLLSSSQSNFACGHRLQQRQPVRVFAPAPFSVEAAHKKGGGSTKNGRDSKSKRRGVKVYGGQPVKAGGIIVRQVGSTVTAGDGVSTGKDYTLFALKEGIVHFKRTKYINQVSVLDFSEYQVPVGNQPKENNRKTRHRAQYTSHAQQRAEAAQRASQGGQLAVAA